MSKERYYQQENFEDEIVNAGDFAHNWLSDDGEDPTEYSRDELIERGSEILDDWDDFHEVTDDGEEF